MYTPFECSTWNSSILTGKYPESPKILSYHNFSRYLRFLRHIQCTNRTLDISHKHHVIPLSLGGKNCKDNIVVLTPREHFIAHHMLIRCFSGRAHQKMSLAFSILSHTLGSEHTKISSRVFDELSRNKYIAAKELLDRVRYDATGDVRSKETRKKMSESFKGRKQHPSQSKSILEYNAHVKEYGISEETREKLSIANKGKTRSEETRKKMSEAFKGRKLPQDAIERMKETKRNKSQEEKAEIKRKWQESMGSRSEEDKQKSIEQMKQTKKERYVDRVWVCNEELFLEKFATKDEAEKLISENGYKLGRLFRPRRKRT